MSSGDDGKAESFVVGGVSYPRPFRIRRLGHFGINVYDPDVSRLFYEGLLGFRTSDKLDFAGRLPDEEMRKHGPSYGYFARHGSEHHSFVFFPRRALSAVYGFPKDFPEVITNQVTWQVGSLQEVVDGYNWFKAKGYRIQRSGRDLPGSNWNVYPFDPDGHVNELFYGIEQIGWQGRSKPYALHRIRHMQPPELPHISEFAEVCQGRDDALDFESGWAHVEPRAEAFNVEGILLGRPFKIVRVGPIRLFVKDMARALNFYRDELGLSVTEEVVWNGHRCLFLRANTEHHSLALYPVEMRAELNLRQDVSLFGFSVQVASYSQLVAARDFLAAEGVEIRRLPHELTPGIDHHFHAIDPDGIAVQFYFSMEQIGWDGKPRPAADRPRIDDDNWPAVIEARPESHLGEPFLGPWN